MIIYEAVNKKNGKRYIGQTIHTLEDRKRRHINSIRYNNSGCHYFKRALIKYGIDSFDWRVIDKAYTTEELDLKESFWIEFFKTTDPINGYNLKGGGDAPYLNESTRKKIGDAQRGSKNHMYGRCGSLNPSSKSVICLDDGNVFGSVSELVHFYKSKGLSLSRVCSVCRGERKTHHGMVFRYLDDYNPNETVSFKRKILNHTTGKSYQTFSEVSKDYPTRGEYTLCGKMRSNGYCVAFDCFWYYSDVDISSVDIDGLLKKHKKRVMSYTVLCVDDGKTYSSLRKVFGKEYQKFSTKLVNGEVIEYCGKNYRLIDSVISST